VMADDTPQTLSAMQQTRAASRLKCCMMPVVTRLPISVTLGTGCCIKPTSAICKSTWRASAATATCVVLSEAYACGLCMDVMHAGLGKRTSGFGKRCGANVADEGNVMPMTVPLLQLPQAPEADVLSLISAQPPPRDQDVVTQSSAPYSSQPDLRHTSCTCLRFGRCCPVHAPLSWCCAGQAAWLPAAATSWAQVYLSFFLGRSWLLWPHFFLRQFLARGCRRA
jgi:hypothetical protein